MRRVTGVLLHPRATMVEVVRHPAFITTWVVVLLAVLACGGLLLSTPVGQQALIDERVRLTETLGNRVDDAEYARLQAHPPFLTYLTSGGRLLVTPELTLLVAVGLLLLARLDGVQMSYVTALAIAVHATVVLALQQILATPVHYLFESLTSPFNIASMLRLFDEGTVAARLLGAIDMFGVWWVWLMAVGLAVASGRPTGRYFGRLMALYVGVAAVVAGTIAVLGRGSI